MHTLQQNLKQLSHTAHRDGATLTTPHPKLNSHTAAVTKQNAPATVLSSLNACIEITRPLHQKVNVRTARPPRHLRSPGARDPNTQEEAYEHVDEIRKEKPHERYSFASSAREQPHAKDQKRQQNPPAAVIEWFVPKRKRERHSNHEDN